MAFMMNDPSRLLGSERGCVVSVKSELKAADTWSRIRAADVLRNHNTNNVLIPKVYTQFVPTTMHVMYMYMYMEISVQVHCTCIEHTSSGIETRQKPPSDQ